MNQVQIIADVVSVRLIYACHIAFTCIGRLGYNLSLVAKPHPDAEVIIYYTALKPKDNPNARWIKPNGLLARQDVSEVSIETGIGPFNEPVIFNHNENDLLGYDVFAAIFFMASRYEEYLPYKTDEFGRFRERDSTSGKYGFTRQPVVHLWVRALLKKLFSGDAIATLMPQRPAALFTYDIDVAYAFRGRSLALQIAGFGKDVVQGRWKHAVHRLLGLGGLRFDPSDTYDYICSHPFSRHFFFLLATQKTPFDRNLRPDSPVLRQLISLLAANENTGIHPSYYSNDSPRLVGSEKAVLEKITGKAVVHSRQHYLRLKLPDTYRQLIKAGIQHDFSMQYPEIPGFRAGMAVPFPFFDVEANSPTPLILHPGCIMETTFRDDLKIPAAESWPQYLQMWQAVQLVGGNFISIWHNDTLWDNLPDAHPLAFRQIHQKLVSTLLHQKAAKYPGYEQ